MDAKLDKDFGWKTIAEKGNFRLSQQMNSTPTYFVVFQKYDGHWTYQIRNRRAALKTGTSLFNKMAG
jgi:hypothetical protein